jgi:hypothetical protein
MKKVFQDALLSPVSHSVCRINDSPCRKGSICVQNSNTLHGEQLVMQKNHTQ